MKKSFQVVLIIAGVMAPVTIATGLGNKAVQSGEPVKASAPVGRSSQLTAKLTLPDGASRLVKVDGVGCTRSICSRTHLKGGAEGNSAATLAPDSIAFDAIDTIESVAPNRARFVLKDGTRKQRLLITDFRVLYLRDESNRPQKLDLSQIKSLQFVTSR
jgi:hypothetical protein